MQIDAKSIKKWTVFRVFLALMVLGGITLKCGTQANAGWRLNGSRYLESVHGDNSCLDCHETIAQLSRHPNPANVNKKMTDFFNPEMCLACHEDVQGQIEGDASHGGEEVQDQQRFFNCIECHDPHYEGASKEVADAGPPEFGAEDQACMTCHQQVTIGDSEQRTKNRDFCFVCHATGTNMPGWVPVMDAAQYVQAPHAELDCLICHPQADRYEHSHQVLTDCRQCHLPHAEKVAHDSHTLVSCQACHLGHIVPKRDADTNEVLWQRSRRPGTISTLHNFIKPDGTGCARCHFEGTTIGAAAMILPPKSVLCMPCHPATFSAGDTVTIVSLAVAFIGLLGIMAFWFPGGRAGESGKRFVGKMIEALRSAFGAIFSARLPLILKTIWWDVLLQRRLYQRSVQRWAIHALIFWPFVIRCSWGLVALIATNYLKSWPMAWILVDKNYPFTAFFFDFSGICMGLGIILAFMRGGLTDRARMPGLPSQGRLALGLLGGIVLVGFILEGMRIALTAAQGPAAYAFVGYGLSRLFTGMEHLNQLYGYVWYLHAVITGAFVAYLPFSRMMHIMMAPVTMVMRAASDEAHS